LHRKIKNNDELLIIIEDENNKIFGGLVTHSFDFRKNFYGTGESFLFKLTEDNV